MKRRRRERAYSPARSHIVLTMPNVNYIVKMEMSKYDKRECRIVHQVSSTSEAPSHGELLPTLKTPSSVYV